MNSQTQPFEVFNQLLFTRIFQAFRMAIQPAKITVAFFAIALICLAGHLMDLSKTVVVTPDAQGHISELQVYLSQPERVILHINGYKTTGNCEGVFATLWDFTAVKFQNSVDALLTFNAPAMGKNVAEFIQALGWTFRYHFIYSVIFTAITFIVMSLAGGCLTRLAAIQFAKGENAGIGETLRFSKNNFTSFFAAPLAPISIVIFMGLIISALGLPTNIPYIGEFITVFTVPVALAGGLLITIILIGVVGGFNLMFPAVAFDGADCFDAISKAFSYVYAKPWRVGFYTAIAAVYGAICYTFVRFCTFLLLSVTHLFLQLSIWADSSQNNTNKLLAIWPEPQFRNLLGYSVPANNISTESVAAFLVRLSLLIIVGLLVSFVISFYFSANTIIYALIRNKLDNTPITDIYAAAVANQTSRETNQPKPQNTQN